MALAMFWLFIGDLVILHQVRIFGHDYFGQHHQPFNKPGKSDDGKTFQKFHKSGDKSDDGHFCLLPFGADVASLTPLFVGFTVFGCSKDFYDTRNFLLGAGLRAPPVIA